MVENTQAHEEKEMPQEIASLIWEQWKYRHSFFWKSFYLLTTTIAVVSTFPLIKISILSELGLISILMPTIGLLIGHWGRLLIEAEYKRISVVGDRYSTAAWSYGTTKNPPYKTNVGKPVIYYLNPAMKIACYGIPALSIFAILIIHACKT